MTVKEQILARPEAAQVVIKAHITKASLDDEAPDYERYGADALAWWDAIVSDYRASEPDAGEVAIADRVIELLRKQGVWGRILRNGSNWGGKMSGWRDSAISASTEISAAIVLEGAEALGYLKSAQQRLDNALEELENSLSEDDEDDQAPEDDPDE